MISEQDKILIDKYAYDNLSEDELKLFGAKIKEPEFAEYARRYTEAVQSIMTVLEEEKVSSDKIEIRRFIGIRRIFPYAAAIIILLGIVFVFTVRDKNKEIAKLKSENYKKDSEIEVLNSEKDTLFNQLAEFKEIAIEIVKDSAKIIENKRRNKEIKINYARIVGEADFSELIAMRSLDDTIADSYVDKKQYAEAIKYWEAKIDEENCEIPIEIGRIALLAIQENIKDLGILKKAEVNLRYSANIKNCWEYQREASLLLLSYCELIKENKTNALLYIDSVLNESTEQNKVYNQAIKIKGKLK